MSGAKGLVSGLDFGPPEITEGPKALYYPVRCAACSKALFTLTETVADSTQTPFRLKASCVACGRTEVVFDAAKDGYDGRCGHMAWLEQGATTDRNAKGDEDEPLVGAAGLRVGLGYNIEESELLEIAAELNVPAESLFDFLDVCVDFEDGRRSSWGFECA